MCHKRSSPARHVVRRAGASAALLCLLLPLLLPAGCVIQRPCKDQLDCSILDQCQEGVCVQRPSPDTKSSLEATAETPRQENTQEPSPQEPAPDASPSDTSPPPDTPSTDELPQEDPGEPPTTPEEYPTEATDDAGDTDLPEPPPLCQSGATQPCYTGPRGTEGQGRCRSGTRTCQGGVWSRCQGQMLPRTETCNGTDDDCDGKTDESYPENGQSCTNTAAQGECRAGRRQCRSGKLVCESIHKPSAERCRDNKDNDCDGKTDEICGPTYPYAIINSIGTRRAWRSFAKVQRTGTGKYELTPSSTAVGCDTRPIFVTPESSGMVPVSISCNSKNFVVYTGAPSARSNKLQNTSFHAVVPTNTRGEVWGQAVYVNLPTSSQVYLFKSYGSPKVRRVSTGVYEIASSNCSGVGQPVLAAIPSNQVFGYATGTYYKSGVCRVHTFDLNGKPFDRAFAFWIPQRNTNLWATVSSSGKLSAFHNFGDKLATWSITRRTVGSRHLYTQLSFSAYSSSAAVLLTPHTSGAYAASILPSGSSFRVYTHAIGSASSSASPFSLLLVP